MSRDLRFVLHALVALACSGAIAGAYEDFFHALSLDDERTVTRLLERGFDPNSVDDTGQPALVLAVRAGSSKVVAVLMPLPSLNVDATNAAGETALMMAAIRGEAQWAGELVVRGAAINREGWAPLHYAASGPSTPLLAMLLSRGAAIEARSPNGSTALMMAARYGAEPSVLLLLEHGADAKARNQRGLNAADFARLGGRDALAERLDAAAR